MDLVSGGTDNHLILIDLTRQGIGGKPVARALDRAGLTANYNAVPFDTRSPFDPSGIRLGTPAVTTRGMTTEHMVFIADSIERGVAAARREDEADLARASATRCWRSRASSPFPACDRRALTGPRHRRAGLHEEVPDRIRGAARPASIAGGAHKPRANDDAVGDSAHSRSLLRRPDPEPHGDGDLGRGTHGPDEFGKVRRQLRPLARHAGQRNDVDEAARARADPLQPLTRRGWRDDLNEREAARREFGP